MQLDPSALAFKKGHSDKEIADVFNYDVKAFADTQDFSWSPQSIKDEVKTGWTLYSVIFNNEVIAAVFLKLDGATLYSKNTPIKITYQGNGFSHRIKEFIEDEAKKAGVKKVINYCPKDNFRLISLNETHGYNDTGKLSGKNKAIMEWEKVLKK